MLQCIRFTRVSASVKTAFAFSFALRYNEYVSHASLHQIRRLLRFSSCHVTMHAFHTRVCIGLEGIYVFLGMGSQCMRFMRLSASYTKAFAFSLVGGHNACVSHACLHLLGRLFAVFFCIVLQCMRFTRVSASVKAAFAFFFNACDSHACLHLIRRLLRFPL